jgi:hypothetical protein
MVTELQFVAVAAFLIWGLVCSLCGVLTAAPDAVHLVKRDRANTPEAATPTTDIAVASARPSTEDSLEAQST